VYLIASLILLAIVLVARLANKWRVPLVVISLFAGILFGSDVAGIIYFDNALLARQIADFALIFVLFIGGFGTDQNKLKPVLKPALVMATIGVIITAIITALSLSIFLKYDLVYAFLIGCIISSTDAAAVFSILRSRSLDKKLSSMVEIESATNDPMAIVLTLFAVQLVVAQTTNPLAIGGSFFWQISGGIIVGIVTGKAGGILFQYVKVLDKGYFYVFLISVILFSYGMADLVNASGMLSAFFSGYFMGNSNIPYKKTLSTLLEAISTIANVVIFVMLGLLVFPHEFGNVYLEGIFLFITLTLIARPLSVLCCTLFSKFNFKDKVFISWSGLRGAVPIVLATYPLAAGIENSRGIFNIVFFAVVLSMVIQGSSIKKVADWLRLAVKAKPEPKQIMELVTLHKSDLELIELQIDEELYDGKILISSLRLPEGTTITMINRNEKIIAPQGSTKIFPGDVLYILVKNEMIEMVVSNILKHFDQKKYAINET